MRLVLVINIIKERVGGDLFHGELVVKQKYSLDKEDR
jgi:hypothetical protein